MKKTTCEEVLDDLKIVLGNMPKRAVKSRERLVRSITNLKSIVAFSKKMRRIHENSRVGF